MKNKKVEMRPIELEICNGNCIVSQQMEIDATSTLSQMIELARELLTRQHRQKVRIGVGSVWSNWIC